MTKPKPIQSDLNPLLRGVLWFLGGLLVLLIIIQILISLFADDYAANYLKKQVRQSSDSTYTLNFDDLDLNVFSGSVSIDNVRINADTAAFSRADSASKKPPKMLFNGTVGNLDVSGVNILSTLWGDELHIGSITITRPNIRTLRNPHPVSGDTSGHFVSADSSIYAAISNRYSALEIGKFSIKDGQVLMAQTGDTLSSIGSLNLKLQNIRVDSTSAQSGRKFITNDFSADVHNLRVNLPDSLNKVQVTEFSISSDHQSIALDSLQLIPRYKRFKFSQKNGFAIDRITLVVPQVKLHGVDFDQYIDSARFKSQFVEIDGADLDDFRDQNLPSPKHKAPPLPNSALLNLKQKIKIDSLKVNNASISYSEYWYQAPQAGTISFKQLNATIYNLTNYQQAIQQGESITMNAQARVMGKGLLQTHFDFPLDTKNGFHTINGSLSKMNFADFNPMLEYVAFVKADRGTVNSLKFNMTLSEDHSSGSLIMNYENLKVSVLDKKSIKQRGIMENIKTFAANAIIKENNTPENGMRAGNINFDRAQRKGVFNYWWKSLLSGIKDSVK